MLKSLFIFSIVPVVCIILSGCMGALEVDRTTNSAIKYVTVEQPRLTPVKEVEFKSRTHLDDELLDLLERRHWRRKVSGQWLVDWAYDYELAKRTKDRHIKAKKEKEAEFDDE